MAVNVEERLIYSTSTVRYSSVYKSKKTGIIKNLKPLTTKTEKGRNDTPPDIISLVILAKRGDSSAMEELYNCYYRKIFRIVYSLCSEYHNTQEIVNDTFVTAFQKINTLEKNESFESWLISIGINHVRNLKRKLKPVISIDDAVLPDKGHGKDDRELLRLHMAQAIKQLPEGYRKVLVLHDIEGYKHEEIAEILAMNVGTSKSQLFKARRELRRILLVDKYLVSKVYKSNGG